MNFPVDPAALQGFPLFQEFTPAEAAAVAAQLESIVVTAGATLFRQGDPSDSVYLLLTGEVEVTVDVPQKADHRLAMLSSGSIIGEMGPLSDEPRAATVRALSEARLARLSGESLEAALEIGERWAVKFLFATARVLARRLGVLNRELVTALGRAGNGKKAEAELTNLRQRLLRDWTF